MNTLSPTEKTLLKNDLEQFTKIQSRGFPIQDVITLIKDWPRVPSEFKLQTIANAILTYYKENSTFGKQLCQMIRMLKETDHDMASYRLGKIIDSWLHQHWTSLPCALLSPIEAYSLFPKHALAPPPIPVPERPFKVTFELLKGYGQKMLERPLEWEGALDSFSALLDHVPQPKNISVIGFGDGKELVLLSKKWPTAAIHGFEQTNYNQQNALDFASIAPNVAVYYENHPKTYRHKDQPIDLALIRHPNSRGICWTRILFRVLQALSSNGTLLMTFYSEAEMRTLKDLFTAENTSEFIWNDMVNPFSYNPSFMSVSGTYSFDLFLVSIRRKDGNQDNFLETLVPVKTRTHEESPLEVFSNRKKFVTIKHSSSTIISQPDFYEKQHKKQEYGMSQSCFKCKKLAPNYFHAYNIIGGKSSTVANVLFCARHVPSTKKQWENMLREPGSSWRDHDPIVYKYNLIGQSIPNTFQKSTKKNKKRLKPRAKL